MRDKEISTVHILCTEQRENFRKITKNLKNNTLFSFIAVHWIIAVILAKETQDKNECFVGSSILNL